ncbi:MAG: hypothetical protein DSZ31_04355 [Gammaproteobacteria bacterium]|nr:MAG: hypothetical protein DSZ31_04355 [Gammaproteobacteria bacterium]
MEISDNLSEGIRVIPTLCGYAIEISSRAGSYGEALNTLREVQKSLKTLGFGFQSQSPTAEEKGKRVTAKVVFILKNPKELNRLVWNLENIKINYPEIDFSLLGERCFISPQGLEKLKQTLREKLLKKAQEMADIFGKKLQMECRLDKLQMEEFKLLLPQRVLEERAKAIWICH